MENINFSLNELEINKQVDISDLNILLTHNNNADDDNIIYDIDQLKLYYSTNYTIKGLSQILQYYGLPKNKMVKEEMIQVLLFFETDPLNKFAVEHRLRLWHNIRELKADPYFSKYILF
jgi:hypothetical protein